MSERKVCCVVRVRSRPDAPWHEATAIERQLTIEEVAGFGRQNIMLGWPKYQLKAAPEKVG